MPDLRVSAITNSEIWPFSKNNRCDVKFGLDVKVLKTVLNSES